MDESVKKKPGGQVGLLIVGFGLAAMGGLFVWALWQGYQRARVTQAWVETPCVVVEAEVESFLPTPNSPVAFRFLVEYEYEFAGEQHVGTRYKRIDGPTSQEDRAEGKLERFPPGKVTVCFVDPKEPSEAVLKRDSKGPLYSIWFPALFMVGGLGIMGGAARRMLG